MHEQIFTKAGGFDFFISCALRGNITLGRWDDRECVVSQPGPRKSLGHTRAARREDQSRGIWRPNQGHLSKRMDGNGQFIGRWAQSPALVAARCASMSAWPRLRQSERSRSGGQFRACDRSSAMFRWTGSFMSRKTGMRWIRLCGSRLNSERQKLPIQCMNTSIEAARQAGAQFAVSNLCRHRHDCL